jgi:hypothetical protein
MMMIFIVLLVRDFEAGDVEGKKAEMLTSFKTKKIKCFN